MFPRQRQILFSWYKFVGPERLEHVCCLFNCLILCLQLTLTARFLPWRPLRLDVAAPVVVVVAAVVVIVTVDSHPSRFHLLQLKDLVIAGAAD